MENTQKPQKLLIPLIGFALIVVGFRLEIINAFASYLPFWDDYVIGSILYLQKTESLKLYDLFQNANEHRLVINRILSLVYFESNQDQWDQRIPMIGNSVLWALSGISLLVIVSKNLTASASYASCLIISLLWVLPIATVNTLWGFQTHTYTMILTTILGCWLITSSALSAKWWLGLACLAIAPLTLAGGTFASLSTFGVMMVMVIKERFKNRNLLISILGVFATGSIGVFLIFEQASGTSTASGLTLIDAIQKFAKSMSWPLSTQAWPALLFATPIFLLLVQTFRQKEPASRMTIFTFSLYGFALITAIAIAYARGSGGYGPARRYFDYLALVPLSSFFAMMQLEIGARRIQQMAYPVIAAVWIGCFLVSSSYLFKTFEFTIKDRADVTPKQIANVMSYLNTKDESWLMNKAFREIPFPRGSDLAQMLSDYNEADILPYQLQTPAPLEPDYRLSKEEVAKSAFKVNGTLKASTKQVFVKPYEQDVFGSYNPLQGGMAATGSFKSTEFHHNRDYIAIPVTGYFGYPGMTIKLEHFPSGREYEVKVQGTPTSNAAEKWTYITRKLPKGYYHLTAQDNNTNLWFGFATPKSVGRLTYRSEQIIENARWVWLLGLVMLLFGMRNVFANLFPKAN